MITFSSNAQWKGKPQKTIINGNVRQTFNGKIVSLGDKWQNCTATLNEMFDLVSRDGFPIAPELVETSKGTRSENTFKSHSIAMVDIDHGMTIDQLKVHPFYVQYGAGFYTSPSHLSTRHRFRVIFVLQQPITDVDVMRKLYTALIGIFGGDGACKDGARLFFGSIDAQERCFDSSKRLDGNIVNNIVSKIETQKTIIKESTDYTPPTDASKAKMLELLKQCYCGNYEIWFPICAAMKHSGYSVDDFIDVTVGHLMSQKSVQDCVHVWNKVSNNHKKLATFGTLVWFVRDKLGDHVWERKTTYSMSCPTWIKQQGNRDGK